MPGLLSKLFGGQLFAQLSFLCPFGHCGKGKDKAPSAKSLGDAKKAAKKAGVLGWGVDNGPPAGTAKGWPQWFGAYFCCMLRNDAFLLDMDYCRFRAHAIGLSLKRRGGLYLVLAGSSCLV